LCPLFVALSVGNDKRTSHRANVSKRFDLL
jgi:hypothetical protein